MRLYFLCTRAQAVHSSRIVAANDEGGARMIASLAESGDAAMRRWLDRQISECREIRAEAAGVVVAIEGVGYAADAADAAERPDPVQRMQ